MSEVVLPELAEADEGGPAWRVTLTRQRPAVIDRLHQATSGDGKVWLEIFRDDRSYLLRFPEAAQFVVTPSERLVACFVEEGTGPSTFRHLLLDQVVPHVLALDGSLVLHASAIANGRGAIAFVGPSGFGKSSLAASFAAVGYPLLADDFLLLTEAVDGFIAVPSYPGLRLWPDSVAAFAGDGTDLLPVSDESEKKRLVPPSAPAHAGSLPLRAIVILGDEPEEAEPGFCVHPISAREGFMAIFEQAFRMERTGRDRQRDEFERFARLAGSIDLVRLDYTRDYGRLGAIRTGILRALGPA